MTMEHEQHQEHGYGYHDGGAQWQEGNSAFNSQHQSPILEHNGFAFNPMPMDSMYPSNMAPPRSTYQSLHPLITPQWPSQLTSQSSYNTPIFSSTPIPSAPISTPVSAPPTIGRSSSTPRKTLTDMDRRRMCIYAEEHPNVKQTEIGGKCNHPALKADTDPLQQCLVSNEGTNSSLSPSLNAANSPPAPCPKSYVTKTSTY